MGTTGAVTALVALVLVVAAVPAGGLAQSSADAAVAPGERLAGVVGVQGAEIEGAVAERTFAQRMQRADTNASKAAVVADRLNRTRERLAALERREERLRRARANGSISRGQYRARMAQVAAEVRVVERALNTTAATGRQLPNETLRAHGVDAAAIERLRSQAANLTGPEVAAIARGIAGPDVGGPPSGVPAAGNRGPPAARGNGSATGDGSPDRANRTAGDGPTDRGNGSPTDGGPPDRASGGANRSDDAAGSDRGTAAGESGDAGNATATDGNASADGEADTGTPAESAGQGGGSQADARPTERGADRRSDPNGGADAGGSTESSG
ncbi:MAG: hypothetical protein ABEJ61_00010 [Haloferacaceae archaeon]